jgi:hypothetical protein
MLRAPDAASIAAIHWLEGVIGRKCGSTAEGAKDAEAQLRRSEIFIATPILSGLAPLGAASKSAHPHVASVPNRCRSYGARHFLSALAIKISLLRSYARPRGCRFCRSPGLHYARLTRLALRRSITPYANAPQYHRPSRTI